jgi:hypothetical protein
MQAFATFLQGLLREGDAVLSEKPARSPSGSQEAIEVLSAAFARVRLDVAGLPVEFDTTIALAAGELLWQACWFLLNRSEPPADVERQIDMPQTPQTAADHLSADLTLRYLPYVHRRARAAAPDDVLTGRLALLLRRWPLSGVLSDVVEGPQADLGFAGHPGLLLLYAERLIQNRKPAWVPVDGEARAYADLIFAEFGTTV